MRVELVVAAIGSPKRRIILIEVGGLGVKREAVRFQRRWPLGQEVRNVSIVVANPVVQAEPDALHREVGIERLRGGRERHALTAKSGREIFGLGRPARADRDLDAGAYP